MPIINTTQQPPEDAVASLSAYIQDLAASAATDGDDKVIESV